MFDINAPSLTLVTYLETEPDPRLELVRQHPAMGLSLRFGLNPKNLRRMCFENRLCLMLGLLRFTTLLQVPGAARPEVFPYGTVASRVLLEWQSFLHKGNKK